MKKIGIVVLTLLFLLPAIALNIWLKDAPFNYSQQIVSSMQNTPFFSSPIFLFIMNIASNLLNPIVAAGYIVILYLISNRKLEILIFLLWFIIVSVGLSFIKILIHQARPFWIEDSDVKMLEWTCYTEYGCPSGHSMLGLVLLQFFIKFINRSDPNNKKRQIIMLICGFILQSLVVFSRMILGMHSLNQVLFGVVLGFAAIVIYHTYVRVGFLRLFIYLTKKINKSKALILNTNLMLFSSIIMLLTLYLPTFQNKKFIDTIKSFEGCSSFVIYGSFQYKCFQDMSLLMAAFGIIYALILIKNPTNLLKVLTFSRLSKKFVQRLLVNLIVALIPVIIFLNPFWKKINLDDEAMTVLLWFNQGVGLLLATSLMIGFSPFICMKLGLEDYQDRLVKQDRQYLLQCRQTADLSKMRQEKYNESIEIPS